MASKRTTPLKSPAAATLKGKAALNKFLGMDPKDKNLSADEKENYTGWLEWMQKQVGDITAPVGRRRSLRSAFPIAPFLKKCSGILNVAFSG